MFKFSFLNVVFSLLLTIAFGVSEASAQQCLDFSDFPNVSDSPSPVVAPPGETLPSDVQLDYIEDYIPYYGYYFGEYNTVNEGLVTFLSSNSSGFLRITFDSPRVVEELGLRMIHFNQPDVEYRVYKTTDLMNSETTPGWVTANAFPLFPMTNFPEELRVYPITLTGYYFLIDDVQVIEVRNLSRKNYFSEICID